jgi:acyl-CoA synthetase (NDP forming)
VPVVWVGVLLAVALSLFVGAGLQFANAEFPQKIQEGFEAIVGFIAVELIVGGIRDPSWGPIVVVGLGGVFAEALADTTMRLAPVTSDQAADMLRSLRGKRILEGFRNLPAIDRDAVADVIVAIGRLMCEHPEISQVEVNPLRVTERGALALDALVTLHETAQ